MSSLVDRQPSTSGKLLPLLMVNFIGSLGYSLTIPFLIYLVTRFGGNGLIYGLLGATYSAFQLVGAPWLGGLSDTFGRRNILLVSQLGTLLAWVVFLVALFLPIDTLLETSEDSLVGAFTLTLPLLMLFLARMLDGLTGGNISVANAYMTDITPEADRKANFGKMGVASGLGFSLGPAIAGILGGTVYGEKLPVLGAIVISLIAVLLIIFRLPESKQDITETHFGGFRWQRIFGKEHKDCLSEEERKHKTSLGEVLRMPGIAYLLLLYFIIFLGFNVFYTAFPLHAQGALGWNVTQLGYFYSAFSILMILAQGPLLSYLSKFVSDEWLFTVGSIILAIGFFCLGLGHLYGAFVAVVGLAVGNGLMWPSYQALLSRKAGDKHQGAIQGYAGSMGSAASIIGLIGGGWVYEHIGPIAFDIACAIFVVVIILSLRYLRKPT